MRRAARRATRRYVARRVALVALAVVVCAAAATSALGARQRERTRPTVAARPAPAPAVALRTSPVAPLPALAHSATTGRTALRLRGAYAVRSGDVVTVHFDEIMTRTRRPDKFERIVRATLPEVYGAAADSMLAGVRTGALVGRNELLTELPVRGIQLRHATTGALTLWPETRPGRDGRLVVAYRTTRTP